MKTHLLAGLACFALAIPARAALVVHHASFITSPTNFNGFEAIGTHGFIYSPVTLPYTEGGITVNYVGSADIYTPTVQTAGGPAVGVGNYVWGKSGFSSGYTDITFAPGTTVTAIQFLAGSNIEEPVNTYTQILYELLLNGTFVAGGAAGNLPSLNSTLTPFGFSGVTFNEILLKGDTELTAIPAVPPILTGVSDGLVLDSIAVTAVAGAVAAPEPGSSLLIMSALGGLATLRRGRR